MGAYSHNGYGLFDVRIGGRRETRAHRASYRLHKGDIPDGFLVCHRCDVPCCVNPDHLFLGTPKDNFNDMVRKGRDVLSGRPPSALTAEAVIDIRTSALGARELAAKYRVNKRYVWAVRTGARGLWKSIPLNPETSTPEHDRG
jgi:hypothetical protein